jgi:hypothetical protein
MVFGHRVLRKTYIRVEKQLDANDNSNLRVAACLPFGKTCYFVNNGRAALNWNPYDFRTLPFIEGLFRLP